MAAVIAVHGPSGSGKTTLIEQLVARLRAQGLSVGVIKHAHKGFSLDRRGKDSHRCWAAGAQAMLVAGPDELFVRRRGAWSSLRELLNLMPSALDCVLVEGFTHSRGAVDVPVAVRLEVAREGVRCDGRVISSEQAAVMVEDAIERGLVARGPR